LAPCSTNAPAASALVFAPPVLATWRPLILATMSRLTASTFAKQSGVTVLYMLVLRCFIYERSFIT
jgi:hypothetical protein